MQSGKFIQTFQNRNTDHAVGTFCRLSFIVTEKCTQIKV